MTPHSSHSMYEQCLLLRQVSPRFQGMGLSKKLLQTAIDHCSASSSISKIVLSTTAMQIPAQKLYEKFGFCQTRTEKKLVGPLKIATMDLIHYELLLNTQ